MEARAKNVQNGREQTLLPVLLHLHDFILCVSVCVKRRAAPVVALFLYPSPHSLPRVYRHGLLWQPQKWPVRALGNVDVQIMTCWKPRTTGLSPAGNWFFSQFIVSICTVHRWFSHFRSRGWAGREEDRCKYGIFPREIGGRCMLANVHMHVTFINDCTAIY